MAMTKKERAEFDAAIERAELLAALRWTEEVEPDLSPPDQGYVSGWTFNIHTEAERHSGRPLVFGMWTASHSHGYGLTRPDQGSSYHGGIRLHSTPLLALRALRHQLELQFAEVLRRVDKAIEEKVVKSETQDENKGIA